MGLGSLYLNHQYRPQSDGYRLAVSFISSDARKSFFSSFNKKFLVLAFYFWLAVIGASQMFRLRVQPEDSTTEDNGEA